MPPRLIKVCGITNLDDALAAVEGGANAIGFNFYSKSKRYIRPDEAAPIAAALPAGIIKVGVFVNESPADVERIAAVLRLDVAQLHGDETSAHAPVGLRVWKAYRVDEGFNVSQLESYDKPPAGRAGAEAEAFVLDGPAGSAYGGGGQSFNWRVAAGTHKRIVIAGGLDSSNVREAIAQARPWGVDACSRLESAPGRKDRMKLMEFLKAATSAEE